MNNNSNVPINQQPQPSSTNANEDEEEIITQLTLANLKVLMVRKGDQIIYKLPNNMQVSSIAEEQRQQLMNEIQSIHAATMAAAAQQQQQLTQQHYANSDSSTKPLAPKIPDKLPQPSAAEFDAMKETARNLREEFERQQRMQQQWNRSDMEGQSPSSSDSKTTRRYNKTGKYSKKRQSSTQSQHLGPQQFVALQPSLQQSAPMPLPLTTTTDNEKGIEKIDPVQQTTQVNSLLLKRLPEEELHHREIKKRFLDALLVDRQSVTTPNYNKPFVSVEDAIERLVAYHIYQYPKEDLNSNQSSIEKQDETTIEIFKCKVDMFEKHNRIRKDLEKDISLKVLMNRQITNDQRQKIAEEQSRIAKEQAAQKEEMLRVQTKNANLTALAEQQARQQMQPQQILNNSYPPQGGNYSNRLAQANALLQNPEFINYFSQLSPESQQDLLRNREQLVALLEKQQFNRHLK